MENSSDDHGGKNAEKNAEKKDSNEEIPQEGDMMDRYLKLVQKWPHIIQLLCQEETSVTVVSNG